ncbi:hypothetical protein [Dysgonomonas macrotermitis]|uniref:Uncharacterized protein n=1 Tax=Dysgonomonas macrotermitis TaxID=1346286 RepID=A0A1M5DCX1_9BACT|nr:hypothetical protein [Dysgonomonas macrotermitis]SHF64849.1 hypothetical protein SAMN05444362_108155 [Dysgonomonas macrotermitis]
MDSVDYLGIIGFIISIISLGFAIFIYFNHDKKIKSQEVLINEYQLKTHQEAETEKKKALIKANIIKKNKGSYAIKVFNSGNSIAKNIRVKIYLDDKEDTEEDILSITENPFPFAMLSPHDNAEISFMAFYGTPSTFYVKTMWDDLFDTDRENIQLLHRP